MCKKTSRWLLALVLLTLVVMAAGSAQAASDVKIILAQTQFNLNVSEAVNVPISLQLPLDVTDTTMSYTSANTAVAVVKEATGGMRIVAMGEGETTLTITHVATDTKVTCSVKVTNITKLTLNVYNVTLSVGGSITLTATALPPIRSITGFITSDSSVCTAAWDGANNALLTGVKAGSVTIYAFADNGTQVTCAVTVTDSASPSTAPVITPTPTPTPTTAPTTQPTSEPTSGLLVYVDTPSGSLNLRSGPSLYHAVLRTIPYNASFICLEYGDTWCKAQYNGTVGYVMTKFVRFTGLQPTVPTATPAPTTPSSGQVLFQARVSTTSGSLNMRTGPWQGASRIRLIPRNAIVDVLQFASDWSYVRYNGDQGYVMTKFLSLDTSGTSGPSSTASSYAQVYTVSGGLNLRKTASSSGKRLMVIPQNAIVEVLSPGSKWCYVSYDGHKGYVMTKYLKMI